MKTDTVQCMSCQHLQVNQGIPMCGFCQRPVTPGNMNVSRVFLAKTNACQMAATLRVATADELLKVERILHGYV